jgi:hypothetical protein
VAVDDAGRRRQQEMMVNSIFWTISGQRPTEIPNKKVTDTQKNLFVE